MRRTLSETMIELADAAIAPAEAAGMRITSFDIDIPIEVRLRKNGDEWDLLADLPQWRWQTGLEELRSRLRLTWVEGGAS
jgi:hypothetical protein